ncbi:hypothetical protein MNBD_ALPHA07-794 [hydrothermal vent metagenome]|uniref:Phospholipid-binding protein n=1 Tax=hydrothermal vent metagenome TaxID=652676 RepID=A0A3B0S547_9ZZZZ
MHRLMATLAALILSATTASAEFSFTFEWGDIPSCGTGRPNTVGSPAFVLKGVPAGTTSVQFRLKDRNAPSYNHGGGKVAVTGDGTIPFGAFKYKSPCPPQGAHTYEWTATARQGKTVLERAKARRKYPE